jgi:iron complex outermembrane receptor protein
MKNLQKSKLAKLIQGSLFSSLVLSGAVIAEDETTGAESSKLEVIQVTARKRVENAQEVPVAVSALQGDNLDAYSSAGMDIRFMNAKIPSLSVESSYGRTFPRFYIRGLGNTDFDLNASQPVSLVVDEVVQESSILKGFPVFDLERIEVLRGPQGTLFGRNTPAGLVKFDSVKPSQEFDGYGALSYSTFNSIDFEGAVGGGITDELSVRLSVLKQTKDDYIDNRAPGNHIDNVTGGYDEQAARLQFLYEDGDFSALLNYHTRDLDAKPITFHANAFENGTNKARAGFDPEIIYQDSVQFATQQVQSQGTSLKLEYDFEDYTLTSITAWESADIFSRADVDGGYGCGNDFVFGCPTAEMGPGFIFLASETADSIPEHDQITQEIRLASNFDSDFNYQLGAYFYNEDQKIETYGYDGLGGDFNWGYVFQEQDTTAWALFASADYTVSDKLKLTGGVRYSDDKRDFRAVKLKTPGNFDEIDLEKTANPADSHVSWDFSGTYKLTDDVNLYARLANGFRAPSVQGRILFDPDITVADSEVINSFEIGVKSDVLDGRGRVNATTYYFQMDDQQLTAVGGDNNITRLLNADKTVGYGFELDSEWILTDDLLATFNISYNKTELQDEQLFVGGCFGCTVLDPIDPSALGDAKRYSINGNSLPHSPEWISNFTLRYSKEIGVGEFFAYTDWSYRSEIDFFLYESIEFTGEALLEGGVSTGYNWESGDNEYQVSAFVRNITDEQVFIGGVDFSNNSAMVNQPRIIGAEFKVKFF